MPGAQLLTLTSSSALYRPRCLRSQTSSGYIAIRLERHQGHSARSPVAHFDELIYSRQVTLPEELDQLRLHCHSATAPGTQQLTLTSSSTLDRSRYLRSQISSGYIALGHSAQSPAAHFDEFVYSGQVKLLEESDQLRLQRHQGHSAKPNKLTWTSSTQLLALTSSFQQFTWTSSTQQLALMTSAKIRSSSLRDQFG